MLTVIFTLEELLFASGNLSSIFFINSISLDSSNNNTDSDSSQSDWLSSRFLLLAEVTLFVCIVVYCG